LRYGFLTDLVRTEDLQTHADQLTATLSSMAPLAVFGMKKHLNRIARGALVPEELAADIQRAAESNDIREGAQAWKEKRTPVFKGN
jgi:1,4-dihydroxy-2-naphthoyl-CoA synthase